MSAPGSTGPAPAEVNGELGKWPTALEFEVGAGTLANRSARIFGSGATKITATVTPPPNKAEEHGNKSELRSARTGAVETGIATATGRRSEAEGIKGRDRSSDWG